MAKAKQLPSGAWRIRVYTGTDINGTKKYISITKDTKKEAEYSALEYRTGRKKVCCADNMLLTDAMGDYIALKTQVLSPTTIRAYKQIRRNHLQSIMKLPLSDITNELIQVEINKISCTLSPKTVHNIFGLLSAVYMQFNPTVNLHITLPQKQRFIPNIPSVEDIKNILRCSKGSEIELAVLLALCLGLRMSEIRALKFSSVQGNLLHITNALIRIDGEDVYKNTKTSSSTRSIYIPCIIMNKIKVLDNNDEYLIKFSANSIYKRFTSMLKRNNLPHFRFHDLRHANASVMLSLNIPDKYAMERMGHSSTNMLKMVYQHTLSEENKKIDDKLEEYFNNLVD